MDGWLDSNMECVFTRFGWVQGPNECDSRKSVYSVFGLSPTTITIHFSFLQHTLSFRCSLSCFGSSDGKMGLQRITTEDMPACKYRIICEGQRHLCNTRNVYVCYRSRVWVWVRACVWVRLQITFNVLCNKCVDKLRIGAKSGPYPLHISVCPPPLI